MYQLIRTFRFTIILLFVLTLIFLFAKYLLLPIIIFVIIMKVFNKIKFNKVKKTTSQSKKSNNTFIDAEYEEVDQLLAMYIKKIQLQGFKSFLNKTTISLRDYARGIYVLNVAYGDKVEKGKVIKE